MKEKYVQRLIDIPDYILDKINKICTQENISLNYFVNKSIINDFTNDLSVLNITKSTDNIPIRIRINLKTYEKLKLCTRKWNISMQKIIIHFLFLELKKYNY